MSTSRALLSVKWHFGACFIFGDRFIELLQHGISFIDHQLGCHKGLTLSNKCTQLLNALYNQLSLIFVLINLELLNKAKSATGKYMR